MEARHLPLQNAFWIISIRLPVPEISSCKEKTIFNRLSSLYQTLLKLEKIWIAITPKIVNFKRRVRDHWKRGTFLFKTLFELFRYDFRFPRYRRVKRKVIFNRFISAFVAYSRSSHWPIPNYRHAILGRT